MSTTDTAAQIQATATTLADMAAQLVVEAQTDAGDQAATVAALEAQLADTQASLDTAVARSADDEQKIADDEALIASLEAQITALQSTPATLSTRPQNNSPAVLGDGTVTRYVAVEDYGYGADGQNINTIINGMIAKAVPGIYTLPYGHFRYGGMTQGYRLGVNIPHGATEGLNGYCHGVVGSGPGSPDRRAPGTYLDFTPNSSTLTDATAGIESAYMLAARDVASVEIGNCRVGGSPQQHRYSGVSIYHARFPCNVWKLEIDGWQGSGNVPPAETTGFTIIDMGDGVMRVHRITDLVADGFQYIVGNKVTGSSPFGGQNMYGGIYQRCTGRNAIAGQVGWHLCDSVVTINTTAENNGSGSGTLAGQGLNHEETRRIKHFYPYLNVPRANGNVGLHVSHTNKLAKYGPGELDIIEPICMYDAKRAALEAQCWSTTTYTQQPTIFLGGKQLTSFLWSHK